MNELYRARFQANLEDSRPVTFPAPHPWWESGFNDDWAIVIAYVNSEEQLLEYWPEANQIDMGDPVDEYKLSSRFSKPTWWKGS